jgi:RNA-directed DNA polymerase
LDGGLYNLIVLRLLFYYFTLFHLLAKIPPHKSLYHARPGIGMPIGSLTNQFFANVYLNELDQFIKHSLKIKGYLRYVDDFIILGDNPQTLNKQRKAIQHFLLTHLKLELHPNKTVMQRCNQGVDVLGSIVFPSHRLSRQRSVRALRRQLAWFNWLIYPKTARQVPRPPFGTWHRWSANHQALLASGVPSPALLQRILATINSYYGVFSHANTYRLRKHIYEKELGPLKQFFLPDSAAYHHLKLKICAQ